MGTGSHFQRCPCRYLRCPLSGKGVWRGTASKAREAAAVVCDWGEGGTVRLTPDCAALGIPANFEAVDMESGAKFAVSGGVAAIPLKKHDFAMVLFRAIASHPGF